MKGYYSIELNKHRLKLVMWDFLILFSSIVLAYFLRFILFGQQVATLPLDKITVYFMALAPQIGILFYIMGFYERGGMATFSRTITKLLFSITAVGLVNGSVFYFYNHIYIGRVVFIFQLTLFFLLMGAGRFFIIRYINKKGNGSRLVLVNLTPKEKKILMEEPYIANGFQCVEFNFETIDQLKQYVEDEGRQHNGHKTIYILSSQSRKVNNNIDFFIHLKFDQYSVYDIDTFYSNVTGKIPADSIAKLWNIISENEFVMGLDSFYKLKRLVDIAVSGVALLLLLPLFVLIPVLIKLNSRGPVYYIQERLGWNKKPFKLIKFRTMVPNAEKDTGPRWADTNDSRITLAGKLLRYTRLDELPQFINVFKGDMSLVGNRPIRKHFSDLMANQTGHYDLRYFIKPGITGWAQVNGSYAVPDGKKTLQYELFYLKNMGILFDLIILLKTLKIVFNVKGR